MERQTLVRYILTAMIIALCAIGGLVKIPLGIATAALDSAPAFISVAFLPPLFAGFAGFLGHMASAGTSGFPLGPFHIIIALEMFVIVYFFGKMHNRGLHFSKWLMAFITNTFIAPLPFYFLMSPAFYVTAIVNLGVATAINLAVVAIAMPLVKSIYKRKEVV